MKLERLIKDLAYRHIEGIADCEIKGISCDSRNIRPGYLFVAIRGLCQDGHSFINQAIAKGAKAVILEENLPLKKEVAKILVRDSRAALASVCAVFFGEPAKSLKTIGITGTNGKTSVSYLIEKILTCAGHISGVVGTINYRIGSKVYSGVNTTPQADLLQSFLQEIVLAKSKYAIIEVSSHALAQHRVEAIDFSTAVFTNLSPEHLDYHSNLDNYFSCKSSLFKGLSAGACAVINIDEPYGKKLLKMVKSRVLTYGIECPAQIQAKNLRLKIDKLKFTAVTPGGKIEIESPLIGRHNVYNILAAIGAAFVEDIDFSHIASGIKSCACVSGRLERVNCGEDFLIFVDYAHTEDALKKVLQTLRSLSKRKIILVFGCGGDRDKTKRPRMGKVAARLADFVILTSDNPRSENPREIISDIMRGISKRKTNYQVILDRAGAIGRALSIARKRDIVLIAGKGHERSQIFADKVIPFNDCEAVKQVLQTNERTNKLFL